MTLSILPYVATTSAEKAKARRQEAKGFVRIDRELDTRVLRVAGKPRLVAREIYNVDPISLPRYTHDGVNLNADGTREYTG